MAASKPSTDGRVLVCGPKIRDLMKGINPFDHGTCMGELNEHYVFAAFDETQLPDIGNSLIADLTLAEADRICTTFLGKTFVFLTESDTVAPTESVMMKFEDWKSLVASAACDSSTRPGTSMAKEHPVPALLISVGKATKFDLVALRKEVVLEWKIVHANVGSWLTDVWSHTGTWMSEGDLRDLVLNNAKMAVGYNGRQFALDEEMKRRLLVCHFASYWKKNKIFYSNQGKAFAKAIGRHTPLTRSAMHSEVVGATCVKAPLDTAKRLFKSMRQEAKTLYPSPPDSLKPSHLSWLLSVIFPMDFAAQIVGNLSVPELTKSSVKRETISPDIWRLADLMMLRDEVRSR